MGARRRLGWGVVTLVVAAFGCEGERVTFPVMGAEDGGGADAGRWDGGSRDADGGGDRDAGSRDVGARDAQAPARDGGVTFSGSLLLADDVERRVRLVDLDGREIAAFDAPLDSVGGVAYDATRRMVWAIAATQASPLLAAWSLDGGPVTTYAPPRWVPPVEITALTFAVNLGASSDALVFSEIAPSGAAFRIWRISDQRHTFSAALPRSRGQGLAAIEYRRNGDELEGFFIELWAAGDAALERASMNSSDDGVVFGASIAIEPSRIDGVALLPGGFAVIDAEREMIGLHDERGRRITAWAAPGSSIVDVAHVAD